jgi:Ca-activated chloride channel family protein
MARRFSFIAIPLLVLASLLAAACARRERTREGELGMDIRTYRAGARSARETSADASAPAPASQSATGALPSGADTSALPSGAAAGASPGGAATGAFGNGAVVGTLASGAVASVFANGPAAGAFMHAYGGPAPAIPEFNTEQYASIDEEGFVAVSDRPRSTFSVDVDTASYSNVRRFLTAGTKPPPGAVRIEELLNYFSYDYPAPAGADPFSVTTEVANAPWNPAHKLVLVGLRGRDVEQRNLPARNLVFLIDVSGSMWSEEKLPLVKKALAGLVAQLGAKDHVALVVYAGASGCVLEPTAGSDRAKILDSIANLEAGGSTNGAGGIRLAYELARKNFERGAINRVILATDGDFNVGVTNESELVELIEHERESGVFLTVLGVGTGNLKDATMEKLADRGNGNYAYLDTPAEARRVLVEAAGATLVTIAKDVKVQVEFNPVHARAYRLIGYENRRLQAKDFNDDKKDAGEIGAGHRVTALYEVVPPGADVPAASVDPLRYQSPTEPTGEATGENELATVKLRYKQPDADASRLLSVAVDDASGKVEQSSTNLRFAAGVATFGMLLAESEDRGSASYEMALSLARDALGQDPNAYRAEFLRLVAMAQGLDKSDDEGVAVTR